MHVVGDKSKIQQVLYNLLDNAIKFSHNNSTITIETREKKNKLFVSVKDTGIGIPAEDLPRIFEKGFTGYNGRENKKSTGIGLYLCKNIMDKLQWNITVDSEVGSGTKIYLTKM